MMDRAQRFKLLDPSARLSIRRQAELLNIPRGKYYYRPRPESPANLHLMDLINAPLSTGCPG